MTRKVLSLKQLSLKKIPINPTKIAKHVINVHLTSALDLANLSNINAIFVLAAVAQLMGLDLTNTALNRESIRRDQHQNRQKLHHI